MPQQILILDSSQIAAFLNCPTEWDYSYNQNLGYEAAPDEPMQAGTFGHKWLEIFYGSRGQGDPINVAVSNAHALKPSAEFNLSDQMVKQIKERLDHYWMVYSANDFAPMVKKGYEVKINEFGLPIDTYPSIPLVEQGFSYPLLDTREYLFILEGKIDLICNYNNQRAFVDHKFQFRKRDLYLSRIQFKNYALATGLYFGVVNYIRLHKEVTKDTLSRQPINFNPMFLQTWKAALIQIYKRIARLKAEGPIEMNMTDGHNWDACEGKFGYPCKFTPVCEEFSQPMKQALKNQLYIIKQEWKPW